MAKSICMQKRKQLVAKERIVLIQIKDSTGKTHLTFLLCSFLIKKQINTNAKQLKFYQNKIFKALH